MHAIARVNIGRLLCESFQMNNLVRLTRDKTCTMNELAREFELLGPNIFGWNNS